MHVSGGGKGGETNDLFRGGSIHEITFDGFVFGNPQGLGIIHSLVLIFGTKNKSTAPSERYDQKSQVLCRCLHLCRGWKHCLAFSYATGEVTGGPGWVARGSPPFSGLMKTHWGPLIRPY